MSRRARWEVLRAVYPRYRGAARADRGRILDEFCETTGYQRKYALRLLNGPPPSPERLRRRRRPATYGVVVIQALTDDLGGRGVSLVRAAEGAAAPVAAVGAPPLPALRDRLPAAPGPSVRARSTAVWRPPSGSSRPAAMAAPNPGPCSSTTSR